jgi:hypothetical protein
MIKGHIMIANRPCSMFNVGSTNVIYLGHVALHLTCLQYLQDVKLNCMSVKTF